MGKLNTVTNGKGSKPRPVRNVDEFINNWDEINWSRKETSNNNNNESNTNSTPAKDADVSSNS
jgi:hypothetical protein